MGFFLSPWLECGVRFKRQGLYFHQTNCHFVCKFEGQKNQLRQKGKQVMPRQQDGSPHVLGSTRTNRVAAEMHW